MVKNKFLIKTFITAALVWIFLASNATAITFDELVAAVNHPIVNCNEYLCFITDTFGWPGATNNKKTTFFSSPSVNVFLIGPSGNINITCENLLDNQFTLEPGVEFHGSVGGILWYGGIKDSVTFEGTNTNTGRMRVNVNNYKPVYKCIDGEDNCSISSQSLSGYGTVLFRDNWIVSPASLNAGSSQDIGCWTNSDQTVSCSIRKNK